MSEAKDVALKIVEAARDKKALQIKVLDMRSVAGFCDYFVIASGNSLRQVNAIAQGITDELAKDKIKSLSKVSSDDQSGWIVLDFSSVIVHIFNKPVREFYALERLWSDAKKVRLSRKSTAKKK
ncbi:MAG TPA: ribosome silencing factor [Candidatus Omnitrophota bacterium]|nr:ribosome silencing factor [Candidatus Omnitrophota bacterium]HPT06727.1 ribosome silencing factor [Candidatus Omnitrophota bacterium]